MRDQPKFRRPSEMKSQEPKEPVSTRLRVLTKQVLDKEAKRQGIPLALIISNVLDDYVAWLQEGKGK